MINVTKTYLPDKEKLKSYIDKIYENGWITNRGFLLRELEVKLADFLEVEHLILVANGTLALQVAYKALELTGDIITTPFSFAATSGSIIWEGLNPVFSDIDSETWCLNPENIEKAITKNTSAIVPVHVFGNACDVESIHAIADKHNLKVVYDAAHAFGVNYKGQSLLNYGDISTLSFHATKLFHTIEGGAIITKNAKLAEKVRKLINFGITGQERIEGFGINAKMNEFEAAMGLCVLDDIETILKKRQKIWDYYQQELQVLDIQFQKRNLDASNNYSYFPVLFESEAQMKKVQKALNAKDIYPRRYFYPSLDTLDYGGKEQVMSVSWGVASRILCLPIYPDLKNLEQKKIISVIKKVFR